MTQSPEPLTVDEMRARPTVTIREAAAFLGVSADTLYEAAARGETPWPILRLGRRLLVPTAPLLESLGIAVRRAEP